MQEARKGVVDAQFYLNTAFDPSVTDMENGAWQSKAAGYPHAGPHPSGRAGDRCRRRSNTRQKMRTSTSTVVVVCVVPLGRVVVVLSTFTPQPNA